MRHDNFILNVSIHSRGRLPHWRADNAAYFITFRLRDSLPRGLARSLIEERSMLLRRAETDAERARIDDAFAVRFDRYLDDAHGSCLLLEHAEVVANSLRHFDGQRYELRAWCVMPNHVHALVLVERGGDVPAIVHSWKSYTAHAIGRGAIWQREYFDRVMRDARHESATAAYIRRNPGKVGLKDWPWVG